MIITLGFRGLQLLFGAIVLALSVVLITGYGPGHAPSLFDYGAVCGGAGLLIAAVGILAIFVDSLQGLIQPALDGLASFFLLAGAIAFAVTLKVGSCTDPYYLEDHIKTLAPSDDKVYKGVGDNAAKYAKAVRADVENRCRISQADTAFLWFMFACFAVTLVVGFMNRSGRRGSRL